MIWKQEFSGYFRMKYLQGDTSTSYVTAGIITSIDPSSTAWVYGTRIYNFENTMISAASNAQAIVDARRTQFAEIQDEVKITAKFCPQLEISDKVELSYRSYGLEGQTLWDNFNWDEENWAEEDNFNWDAAEFKILAKSTNLDNFTTTFRLRRIAL